MYCLGRFYIAYLMIRLVCSLMVNVVLQELQCLPNCVCIIRVRGLYYITSQNFLTLHLLVSVIAIFPEAVYC